MTQHMYVINAYPPAGWLDPPIKTPRELTEERYRKTLLEIVDTFHAQFNNWAHESGERLAVFRVGEFELHIVNKDHPAYCNILQFVIQPDLRLHILRLNNHPKRVAAQLMATRELTVTQAKGLIVPLLKRTWEDVHTSMRSLERLRLS